MLPPGDPLDELCAAALEALKAAPARLAEWVQARRPADGARGRFEWARQTTRPANVAATAYILGGLRAMGLTDQVITDADREEGAAWIRSMHIGGAQYRDLALLGRRTPDWPADAPWPSPAMLEGVNQYALNALRGLVGDDGEVPQREPPPGWPQAEDAEATALEWITTRPAGTFLCIAPR